ncbi:MAG: hypothetical protein IKF11_05560 [Methanobrevibacter sp.]|nr:hypothetical protein [Methanobrevibacter sp.]
MTDDISGLPVIKVPSSKSLSSAFSYPSGISTISSKSNSVPVNIVCFVFSKLILILS